MDKNTKANYGLTQMDNSPLDNNYNTIRNKRMIPKDVTNRKRYFFLPLGFYPALGTAWLETTRSNWYPYLGIGKNGVKDDQFLSRYLTLPSRNKPSAYPNSSFRRYSNQPTAPGVEIDPVLQLLRSEKQSKRTYATLTTFAYKHGWFSIDYQQRTRTWQFDTDPMSNNYRRLVLTFNPLYLTTHNINVLREIVDAYQGMFKHYRLWISLRPVSFETDASGMVDHSIGTPILIRGPSFLVQSLNKLKRGNQSR